MVAWEGGGSFDRVLEAARVGDGAAFAVLWRWLHPPLLRWLSVVAPRHIEDVESETWLSVTRSLATFAGGEAEFRGWVFTIARRRAMDWARRGQRQPLVAALEGIDVADPVATPSPMEEASALGAALALLRQLTPDQREVVALRVIVGLTVGETAAVVNKSDGAVRVLCHRGLRALAQTVEADEFARGVAV
jgi:RNA polymerase sigma-70 factor, ECF subfamily